MDWIILILKLWPLWLLIVVATLMVWKGFDLKAHTEGDRESRGGGGSGGH